MRKLTFRPTFVRQFKQLTPDVQKAAKKVMHKLQNTEPGSPNTSLRLHRLTDVHPPTFKIDVFSNHSWQIVFRIDGSGYDLIAILKHKEADRLFK